ncbi:PhoH family protein [Porphyromonas sp.]|uniref:PhoH family protein n=1 Tax=Porphyromonas sp. TaxID=1924944 RepID=UPI0026DC9FA1|nr:PhoH family protein [Porphyromonas sp.]MDO4771421.1 PhoH family protein [Porphyromonas sp.]
MNSERIYLVEEADPTVFFGPNNKNLSLLKALYPKLRIMARGNIVKVIGEPDECTDFVRFLSKLEKHTERYNVLDDETIVEMQRGEEPKERISEDVIIYGAGGKAIKAFSANQREMVRLVEEYDLVFATGPAGSGKTFMAIVMAVKMLKSKQARRIILSRPAVEAGEKLGFLPGEMKDKLDPYLQPLYDALQELIPAIKLKEYMEMGVIQIAPLAFMRGRTLNDAVIILDEAQNTTPHQMKMFLTRLGMNGKMIVTGDMSQIDLPKGTTSGLKQALGILKDTQGIGRIAFEKKDIARHGLVKAIVEAYDEHDRRVKAEREAALQENEDDNDSNNP